MASALLANRNEPSWGERKVYMRKNPNPNPHLKANFKPERLIHDHHHPNQIRSRQADESATISGDSSSLNWKSISLSSRRGTAAGGYVTFNIAAYSRKELKELKKRLIIELEQVRSLASRIDLGEIHPRSGYSTSQLSGGYAAREASSATRPPPLHLNHRSSLNSPVADGTKEKRTPKDAKKVLGSKRPPPLLSGGDSKRPALDPSSGKLMSSIMKRCDQILVKMMKHKHGWIFNTPVDVVGLGLHDYNQIVKQPMDLGTVKDKLRQNIYASPLDFASDVRLTFNNALIYNPKGHEVHAIAEKMLALFEDMFEPACKKFQNFKRRVVPTDDMPRNSWAGAPLRDEVIAKRPDPVSVSIPAAASNPSPERTPAPTSAFTMARQLSIGRSVTGKQPKPKAKDPNKREMTLGEKEKLGMSLQDLPQEKMEQVVQIIRKRNANVAQHGDEIELDIEVLDKETLWDLDRFVSNCKKTMSKMRRQSFASNEIPAESNKSPISVMPESPKPHPASQAASETVAAAVASKKSKKGETMEEDVDIGEELVTNNFPPVEIEKDAAAGAGGGYASRSSSSSSSSSGTSSSSDSDSGSSSGSDSDADDAQSPRT